MTEPTHASSTRSDRGELSRRVALTLGLAVPTLAACGEGIADNPGADASPSCASTPSTRAPAGGLAATSDIPVGGGVVFCHQGVVVTQPSPGTFKGFTSTCTHQGCQVAEVTDTINCTCHGSKFSIADGAVENPPAPRPLPAEEIMVEGNSIRLA